MACIVGSRVSKLSPAYVAILITVFSLALTRPLFCQNTDLDSAHDIGMPVYGVYDGDSVVSVQVNNGNVHIEIPIWTAAERGPQVGYKFVYNSKAWQAHENNCPGCVGHVSQDVGSRLTIVGPADYIAGIQTRSTVNCGGTQGGTFTRWSGFFLQEPDGTKHAFYGSVDVPTFPVGCVHGNTSLTAYAEDGSGWMYVFGATNGGEYTKHGTRILSTVNGSSNSETITDANGNQVSASSPSQLPGTWTVTDTLGRTLVNDGSYFDSNGTLQHLAITYTTVQLNFAGFCLTCAAGGFPQQLPQTITFPNGMSYTFAYVQNSFGQPSSVTLPNGGIIGLTWSGFDKGGPNVQTRSYTDTSGQTSTWTYTQSGSHIGTLTDPLGNDMTVGCFTIGFPNTPCYVNQVQYFAGPASGGKVVKTVTTDYQTIPSPTPPSAAIMPIRVTTALNVSPGSTQTMVSKVETDYETANLRQDSLAITWGNPAAKREYDFGINAPGALLRQNTFTYLHDVSTQYRTTNIADRVLTAVICNTAATCDGTGSNTVAQTQNVYDSGSLVSTGTCSPATGALGHDYCNFGSSNTLRGNPTQGKQWLNPGGIWLSTINAFDDLGHVISTTDPNSNVTLFSYTDNFTDGVNHNALAFATKVTYPITAGVSHIQRKQYFFNTGLLAASCGENFPSASVCANTYSTPQPDYATYAYDLMNRKVSVTNGDGGSSTFCYSDMGGATCSQTGPPFKVVTSTAITATTNKVSTALLDGFGRVKQAQLNSDPEGTVFTDTTYDTLGRVNTVSNPYRAQTESTYGLTTRFYDALGRVCLIVPPDGTLPSGNSCPATPPTNTVFTTYSGNTTTEADEAGKSRTSVTDGLGRLVNVFEDPSGLNLKTDYTYDALNNLLSVTQKGGTASSSQWRTRNFSYDSLSRLSSASNPESGTISYTYDLNANLLSKTAPLPNQSGAATVTTNYSYDALNRVTGKTYKDGTVTDPFTAPVLYGYDAVAPSGCTKAPPTLPDSNPIGRRTSMCDGSGSTSWDHDPMGRILQDKRFIGAISTPKFVNYGYNLDGSLAYLTTPPIKTLAYSYDNGTGISAGRPIRVLDTTDTITFATGATYAPPGELTGLTVGGITGFAGFTITNAYNRRLQPILLSAKTQTATVFSECFDFHLGVVVNTLSCSFSASTAGDNGNVYQIKNNRDSNRTQNFLYDSLNRIQQAYSNGTNWGETFSPTQTAAGVAPTTPGIDSWGNLTNRSGVTGKTGTELFSCPASTKNQLTTCSLTYDAAGNVIQNGSASYVYDAENRVIATAGISYLYDGDGERREKCTQGSTAGLCVTSATGTLYWRNTEGEVLDETDLAGNTQEEYIYFGGQRIARRTVDTSGNTVALHYYFSDHLGSHGVVENGNGTACEQDIDYFPYGGVQNDYCATQLAQKYKFTGQERDSESGNDYFINRYYGSSLGRFMSPDLANWGAIDASPQTWNAYSYVANNPLNATDPDGLDCVYTSGQSPSSVSVTVVRGDCLSDIDNGVYVNGTVDVNSLTYSGKTGDLGFSYTNKEVGSTGVGIDALGRPPSSDPFSYARSVFSQPSLQTAAATMNDPRTYAIWFGASATLGYGLYAAGAFEAGGALTTLSGENGLDLIGNRAINQMIGDGQRELLKEFFETGKVPEGLTEKSLQLYKEVAQRAIAAGKDELLGVQEQRLQMITRALMK